MESHPASHPTQREMGPMAELSLNAATAIAIISVRHLAR
jgi:hypothetical protein